jgi:putative transposase
MFWHTCHKETRLARLPRFAVPGQPQHVIQRGNNRTPCFNATSDYRAYHGFLQEACAEHSCVVHAYVLMTNHVHLLMTPSTTGAVGKVMQSVGRRYVGRFNSIYQRTGTLWEGRYRATVVDRERYLFACYRYIELNPIRAGLAEYPRDYRWSSYSANAHGAPDDLVTPHDEYIALGKTARERQTAYRALFATALSERLLSEIRLATNKAWALGGRPFRVQLASRGARRPQPMWAGRLSTSADDP